jgi:hypothetical protein
MQLVAPKQMISISSDQQNLMKTYHNEANTGGITKIALKMTPKIYPMRYFSWKRL